ncbi:hypothetical protein BG006_006003, partial [Podila minutissima]
QENNHGEPTEQQVRHEVKKVDGLSLHGAVLQGFSTFLVYDANLIDSRPTKYATRSVVGHFACKHCRPLDPWSWKCGAFAEPQVDLDDYARKLTGMFKSWEDERPPSYAGLENDIWTDPHDSERCHGCLKGVWPKGDKDTKGTKDTKA